MRLEQSQIYKLSQQQIQGLELLQPSSQELDSHLQELAMSNPMVELEERYAAPDASRKNELLHRLRWLEENDRQNLYYHRIEEGGLSQCLSLQLERLGETGTALAIVRTCLDALARRSYRAIASGLGLPVE